MQIRTFPAPPRLAPWVREFRVVETGATVERVLVPEPSVLLGLRYGGAAFEGTVRVPDATLTGLRATARHMRTTAGGGMVLVVFRELGATRFVSTPVHELFGHTVELESLVPRDELARASDEVCSATSHEARVTAVTQFLARVQRDVVEDRLVSEAVRQVHATQGPLQVGALARALGLSRDRFEKRFRSVVGASARQFASLVRVRKVVSLAPTATRLTDLALELGYFDQSHFIREFRAFTGQPPGRFLRDAAFC